ncbi:hypothetical protein I7I50_08319 [Histoplasma capsulatum G186AR]|uniref:Uncharacterized protein n=1 Tax=Ajellomyces capsulatus TaxID=5037 RepID=A0A8H7YSU7_AJECA|nr:hypothetical protein I7I52_05835 [Histoplasma capsulatum]QSS73523.1 hypothetical protein I7I50_08319 [Histoplasma capsulatum G186AR]
MLHRTRKNPSSAHVLAPHFHFSSFPCPFPTSHLACSPSRHSVSMEPTPPGARIPSASMFDGLTALK